MITVNSQLVDDRARIQVAVRNFFLVPHLYGIS